MSNPILQCEGLGKAFKGGGLDVSVLSGINLAVQRRSMVHRRRYTRNFLRERALVFFALITGERH